MIRGFLFGLIRILAIVLVFYLVSSLIRGVLRSLGIQQRRGTSSPPETQAPQPPPKQTIPYTDVKDANFKELPKDDVNDSPGK